MSSQDTRTHTHRERERKRERENSNANYEVKEVNLKRLQTVWFQLYDILEKAKPWIQWKDQGLEKRGMNTEDF